MASFSPTMRFSSVDLPALGRPRKETKPDFMASFQIPNPKSHIPGNPQLPTAKEIPTSKTQGNPNPHWDWEFRWDLGFGISLGFGIWDLGFPRPHSSAASAGSRLRRRALVMRR